MIVKSIIVNGYRSFGNTNNELKLNPGVTTIVGVNGSGKSNLMDIIGKIDLANGMNSAVWNHARNRKLNTEIQIKVVLIPQQESDESIVGKEETIINLEEPTIYQLSGGLASIIEKKYNEFEIASIFSSVKYANGDQRNEVINAAKSLGQFSSIPLNRYRRIINQVKQNTSSFIMDQELQQKAMLFLEELDRLVDQCISILPQFFYHNERKHLQDRYSIEELQTKNKNNQTTNLDSESKANDLFLSLIKTAGIERSDVIQAVETTDFAARLTFQDTSNKMLEQKVMMPLRKFYKNNSENLTMRFHIERNLLQIAINTGVTATYYTERSNGLKWYLNMFIDLMNSVNVNRPVVYVLDEPGVHLHINAQNELRSLFFNQASDGTQIIYTTHSPYMIDENLACIRSITKDPNAEISIINNSIYGKQIAHQSDLETLTPIADAIGMDIKLSPGLSPQKLNVIVEGITDQIYLHAMIKKLEFDDSKFCIIPSTGADKIHFLCSILMGWGFRFIALFDYDDKGKRCCKELEKTLGLNYMSGFMMLKNMSEEEYAAIQKIDDKNAVVIESLISEEDRSKYEIHRHGTAEQKKINAVKFADAISKDGQITKETMENFLNVLQAIEAYANREAEEGIPSC